MLSPGGAGKDGSRAVTKSARAEADITIGAVVFGPFKRGTIVQGFWMSGNTTEGFTPSAVFARALRSIDGVALGAVSAVADGPDLMGGNVSVDDTIAGGALAGCPVPLTGQTFFTLNSEVDEFPYIVVYFGSNGGLPTFANVALVTSEAMKY